MTDRAQTSGQAQPLVRGTTPEIVVHGRHVAITDELRGHVARRLGRVERFGIDIMRIDVEMTHHANPRMADRAFTAQLTCRVVGPVVRAEAHASDPLAAVDLATEHLNQRLERAATRRTDRSHGRTHRRSVERTRSSESVPEVAPASGQHDETDVVYERGPIIVREKRHQAVPMSMEHALEAMESVGHDFYLFHDSDSGLPSVVYRRRGWQYGLIRLETVSPPE